MDLENLHIAVNFRLVQDNRKDRHCGDGDHQQQSPAQPVQERPSCQLYDFFNLDFRQL
jgi:hypothetical protein